MENRLFIVLKLQPIIVGNSKKKHFQIQKKVLQIHYFSQPHNVTGEKNNKKNRH